MFNYDWFHGPPLEQQQTEARVRCARVKFANLSAEDRDTDETCLLFLSELVVRTLVYLRDGFSYEVKQLVDLGYKSHLVFECEPVDDQYKVGAFVVTVPFEEIVRVEVFAVHPAERPDDLPQITGFRGGPEPAERHEERRPGKGQR